MMDCDDVFDVLTRGPFPTGDRDDCLVDRHLAECLSCRELAEALRPAVELFRESIEPSECAALPGYRGAALVQSGIAIEVGVRQQLAAAERRPRGEKRHAAATATLRIAAALLLGVSLATAWNAVNNGDALSTGGLAGWIPDDADQQAWASGGAAHFTLAALPSQCQYRAADDASGDGRPLLNHATIAGVAVACCTECHTSGAARGLGGASKRLLARACSACH